MAEPNIPEILTINPVARLRKLVGDQYQGWNDRRITDGIKGLSWHWHYEISGDRRAVVARGLAEEHWFASGLDQFQQRAGRGHVVRSKTIEVYGRTVETQTFKNSTRVRVRVQKTPSEQATFEQQIEAAREAEEEQQERERQAQRRAEEAAEEASKTPHEWRASCLTVLDSFMPAVLTMLRGSGHHPVSEVDLARVQSLIEELRATVVRAEVLTAGRHGLRVVK